ncbi:MAG: hypothetical protein QOK29_1601 [Rhodospirillaceae bacterium]|jgi:hypothetical protein|nr:hypothetical protein [Rhodospirillaceae bacterium]
MASITKKDAGEARERPKPQVAAHTKTGGTTPLARPAGIAPVFDAATSQLTPRAGSHKGMISNPWVKHWTGAGPAPTSKRAAGAQAQPGSKTEAAPKAKGAPETESRRVARPRRSRRATAKK